MADCNLGKMSANYHLTGWEKQGPYFHTINLKTVRRI